MLILHPMNVVCLPIYLFLFDFFCRYFVVSNINLVHVVRVVPFFIVASVLGYNLLNSLVLGSLYSVEFLGIFLCRWSCCLYVQMVLFLPFHSVYFSFTFLALLQWLSEAERGNILTLLMTLQAFLYFCTSSETKT